MDTEIVKLNNDGVTDDTAWFQAALDGRLISFADGSPIQYNGPAIAAVTGVYIATKTTPSEDK